MVRRFFGFAKIQKLFGDFRILFLPFTGRAGRIPPEETCAELFLLPLVGRAGAVMGMQQLVRLFAVRGADIFLVEGFDRLIVV